MNIVSLRERVQDLYQKIKEDTPGERPCDLSSSVITDSIVVVCQARKTGLRINGCPMGARFLPDPLLCAFSFLIWLYKMLPSSLQEIVRSWNHDLLESLLRRTRHAH